MEERWGREGFLNSRVKFEGQVYQLSLFYSSHFHNLGSVLDKMSVDMKVLAII